MIKIMVVDNHPIYRDGLKTVFAEKKGFTVVAEAENGEAALQLLNSVHVDLMLLDIRMPVLDGIVTLQHVKNRFPRLKVIMLTAYENLNTFSKAMSLGADGFYASRFTSQVVFQTAIDVMDGKVIVSPELLKSTADYRSMKYVLTDQDLDILKRIAKGEHNSKIAHDLHFSERTIKGHLTNIYSKLRVDSRAAAVAKAMQLELIKL